LQKSSPDLPHVVFRNKSILAFKYVCDLLEKEINWFLHIGLIGVLLAVQVGDQAPDFTLPSQTGDNVTLSEYRGRKNVVLYFYPKDETIGCTKEACAFRDSYDGFTQLGAEVLGVSGQSVESHKGFASHHGLPFLLLADVDNKVRHLFGVPANMGFIPGRVTYIIDKQDIVRHIFNSQYQPEKHIEEAKRVLEKLNAEEKGQVEAASAKT
jgi:thioredoxin-dependent peroxiredoxin